MKILKSKNLKSKIARGFTLVETLVAISILMIAIASPLSIAQKGLSTAILSQDEMTASFLAEDGLEAVKNLRDDVAIGGTSGEDWLCPFDGSSLCPVAPTVNCVCTSSGCATNFTNYCNIDTTSQTPQLIASSSANAEPVKTLRDANGNFIDFNTSASPPVGDTLSNSKFYRYINVHKSSTNSNEAAVSVKVSWTAASGPQSIILTDFIYNYSENL